MIRLLTALYLLLRKLVLDLTTDRVTGRFSAAKIGEVVAGAVWTAYMVRTQPHSVEMWLAYAATVMGWSSVRYAMKKKLTKPDEPKEPAS